MKITFIRPSITGGRAHDAMEPLVFAILAALTPGDVELSFFDERIEPLPECDEHRTDLVALTVETYTARRAYQIASSYRRAGVPVVLGGYHPTFVPDEALQYADSVVIGDGEGVWPQIVADARAGKLRPLYRNGQLPSLAGLRLERGIFRRKRYQPVAPVQYGRGCRYACDFCSIHAFYGSNTRQRPAREVAAEIERLGRRFVLLVDDNLFVDPAKAEELFRALAPLGIRWGCQVSIDVAADERLLTLMEHSGCIAALIGFESLDEESLDQMNKRWNLKHGSYPAVVRRFQDHGIMIYGSFVFGYDHDTPDIFDRTVDLALESKFFLVNFAPLMPTPGSKLYDRLKRENRLIFDHWWLDADYRYGDATFRPARMSARDLTSGCVRARWQFYRYASILKRAVERDTNCRSAGRLGIYLLANLISRRELDQKLGQPLGRPGPVA